MYGSGTGVSDHRCGCPPVLAIVDSFRELSLTMPSKRGQFVGLDNYRELLGTDTKFYVAIAHTVVFMAIVVPIEFVFGLLIALWINREFTGRRLVLTILMIPTMIAPVVVIFVCCGSSRCRWPIPDWLRFRSLCLSFPGMSCYSR